MTRGTVTVFRDDGRQPHAELVLRNGGRLQVRLGPDGLAIMDGAGGDVLFSADAGVTSDICAGLSSATGERASPLRILVAALVQMESAEDVKTAFEAAAAKVGIC